MTSVEEQQSLMADPLPPVSIPNPLSYVWECDRQIAVLQERISDLMRQRAEALDYAVKEQIAEDENCRLETKLRRVRTLNAERFREVFPQEWEMARQLEIRDLNDRLTHAGEKINLTLVDKLVKKPVLEAAQGVVTVKESKTYEVVRK